MIEPVAFLQFKQAFLFHFCTMLIQVDPSSRRKETLQSVNPKSISLVVVFFLLWSIESFAQNPAPFQWLIGIWEINTGSGIIQESWQLEGDSTLAGKSVFIKNGKDTIPQETLTLAHRNGEWHYISTVVGQNNNAPVEFKVIYLGRSEFISENPSHDFPQRIAYRKVSDQLMYASIEGRRGGKYAKQNFNFNKK